MTNEKTSDTRPRKNALVLFIHKLGSPPFFYNFTGKFIPWLWLIFPPSTSLTHSPLQCLWMETM